METDTCPVRYRGAGVETWHIAHAINLTSPRPDTRPWRPLAAARPPTALATVLEGEGSHDEGRVG